MTVHTNFCHWLVSKLWSEADWVQKCKPWTAGCRIEASETYAKHAYTLECALALLLHNALFISICFERSSPWAVHLFLWWFSFLVFSLLFLSFFLSPAGLKYFRHFLICSVKVLIFLSGNQYIIFSTLNYFQLNIKGEFTPPTSDKIWNNLFAKTIIGLSFH